MSGVDESAGGAGGAGEALVLLGRPDFGPDGGGGREAGVGGRAALGVGFGPAGRGGRGLPAAVKSGQPPTGDETPPPLPHAVCYNPAMARHPPVLAGDVGVGGGAPEGGDKSSGGWTGGGACSGGGGPASPPTNSVSISRPLKPL